MNNTRTLAVTIMAIAMTTSAVGAETLRLLTSWPSSDTLTYAQVEGFKDAVEAGNADLQVELNGPEVVPAFEQLQPVKSGVFDLLYTHGAYHAGSRGLGLVTDVIAPDVDLRRSSGVFAALDAFYQETHGLKLIAISPLAPQGYHCYFRMPIDPENDWSGLKVRGISSFQGVIAAMGAQPVAMPFSETYTALDRGVVDGACGPSSGMVATKHYEVAPYRVMPSFGNVDGLFLMNLNRWNGLSDAQKALIEKVAVTLEHDNLEAGHAYVENEQSQLENLGVQVVKLSPENADIVQDGWVSHNWQLAETCCGEAATALRELAENAGLTK